MVDGEPTTGVSAGRNGAQQLLPDTLDAHGSGAHGDHGFVTTLSALALRMSMALLTMSLPASPETSLDRSAGPLAGRAEDGKGALSWLSGR